LSLDGLQALSFRLS